MWQRIHDTMGRGKIILSWGGNSRQTSRFWTEREIHQEGKKTREAGRSKVGQKRVADEKLQRGEASYRKKEKNAGTLGGDRTKKREASRRSGREEKNQQLREGGKKREEYSQAKLLRK